MIVVSELGQTLEFTFEEALRYAGPHSPAGVAIGFKALQSAFAALSPAGLRSCCSTMVET